jgi:phenylpropionate dioxygenase-like ring-hydroxylating dioxygenase large terminal subunit
MLPPRCYTDPDFYALEVERVFKRNWIPVGRTDQVPNVGDYFTTTRFGEPILVVRDKDSTLVALSNVCRHRSYPVAQGAGNCRARRFTCSYHGWSYDLSGQLRTAPQMEKTGSFRPADVHLPRFGIDVWQGTSS